MSLYFSQKIIKILHQKLSDISKAKILILGVSFKENCPDIRNSKIFDLIAELQKFNLDLDIFDPISDSNEVKKIRNLDIISNPKSANYNLIVITVKHDYFKKIGILKIRSWCKSNGSILDLK